MCLWSEKDRVKREDASVHKTSTVRMLMWSPEGTRLISGDAAGVLGVWQVRHHFVFYRVLVWKVNDVTHKLLCIAV